MTNVISGESRRWRIKLQQKRKALPERIRVAAVPSCKAFLFSSPPRKNTSMPLNLHDLIPCCLSQPVHDSFAQMPVRKTLGKNKLDPLLIKAPEYIK